MCSLGFLFCLFSLCHISLRPLDAVVYPRLAERRHKLLAALELTLSVGETFEHLLVGGDGLGSVDPVGVRHVAPTVGLQEGHTHADDVAEELPDGVVALVGRHGSVGEIAEDEVVLFSGVLKGWKCGIGNAFCNEVTVGLPDMAVP